MFFLLHLHPRRSSEDISGKKKWFCFSVQPISSLKENRFKEQSILVSLLLERVLKKNVSAICGRKKYYFVPRAHALPSSTLPTSLDEKSDYEISPRAFAPLLEKGSHNRFYLTKAAFYSCFAFAKIPL